MKRNGIGSVVVEEVLNNMRAGAEHLYYTVQVPSVYHVYLHQTDYERLLPIEAKLVAEMRRALEDELASLNRRAQSPPHGLLDGVRQIRRKVVSMLGGRAGVAGSALRYEKGGGEWQVNLYGDTAGELKPGDVMVESELALAANAELGAGLVTKTIRTVRMDGVTKSFEAGRGAGPRPTDGTSDSNSRADSNSRSGGGEGSHSSDRAALASISYKDGGGVRREYLMRKEKINIGKGDDPDAAPSHWVDLSLEPDPDLSPLHVQVSFDAGARKFFIKDLSSHGTRVNGRLIRSSLAKRDGRVVDVNVLEELPSESRVSLANKITLDFKSLLTE